ncbi:unnamed protein product, partial [Timema podura]|nr:unnamed protein product [Timema podura]
MDYELNSVHVVPQRCAACHCHTVHYSKPNTDHGLNNGLMFSSPNLVVPGGLGALAKKVPNKSCTLPSMGLSSGAQGPTKKPIELSHLPKRPPVDIQFDNMTYSVSEGRRRG